MDEEPLGAQFLYSESSESLSSRGAEPEPEPVLCYHSACQLRLQFFLQVPRRYSDILSCDLLGCLGAPRSFSLILGCLSHHSWRAVSFCSPDIRRNPRLLSSHHISQVIFVIDGRLRARGLKVILFRESFRTSEVT